MFIILGVDHIWCWSNLVISHLKGISLFFNQWTQKKRNSFIFVTPRFFSEFVKKNKNIFTTPRFFFEFLSKIWKFSTKILGTPRFFSSIFCQKNWNCDNFLATPEKYFGYPQKIFWVGGRRVGGLRAALYLVAVALSTV